MRAATGIAGVSILVLALLSCRPGPPELGPTRGYVLISLDTLRADRLGAYGSQESTSPFFDALAAGGILFEHVAAPYPATLTSHMSMFTGLYPPQHGVYPPDRVLAAGLPTVTELLRDAGFRTAAHTEGGFLAKGYGFERGFEVYDDSAHGGDTDIEATFARGLAFLRGLDADERFFLFLHSYSIHDPYDPPDPFARDFDGSGAPPDSSGERLRDFNQDLVTIAPAEVERFSRRYDASVRYVDSVLADFVAELRASGLLEQTTLVITSDHGEEFLEHGRLAHTQLYPEVLAVPWLIVHPELPTGQRVREQVSLVDLAPTLLALAGVEAPAGWAGRSLVYTAEASPGGELSYAEMDDARYLQSLIGEVDGARYQLLAEGRRPAVEGAWFGERVAFDAFGARLVFRGRSFHAPRQVSLRADGELVGRFEAAPEWRDFAFDLPGPGLHRLELETDGCLRPVDVGESADTRCLGLLVQGPRLVTVELFDLDHDPAAQVDLARDRPLVTRRLLRELQGLEWAAVEDAGTRDLSDLERQRLRALGYLD